MATTCGLEARGGLLAKGGLLGRAGLPTGAAAGRAGGMTGLAAAGATGRGLVAGWAVKGCLILPVALWCISHQVPQPWLQL